MHKLLFALLLLASCHLGGCYLPYTPDTPKSISKVYSKAAGASYYSYVPSHYSKMRSWPVVITLHGSFIWDGPMRQALEWKYYGEKHGLIIIAPTLSSAEGILPVIGWEDKLRRDEKVILAILDDVKAKYNVDPEGVLLTGFSAGGYPMYFTGLRNPDKFSMLMSRAGNCSERILNGIRLSERAKKLPIMIFCGKNDVGQIQTESWAAFRWLRQHGVKSARMKKVSGGHLRRPDTAYELWRPHLPEHLRMNIDE